MITKEAEISTERKEREFSPPQIDTDFKACLNFPLKSFYQLLLSLFSVFFFVFFRHIARYAPQ